MARLEILKSGFALIALAIFPDMSWAVQPAQDCQMVRVIRQIESEMYPSQGYFTVAKAHWPAGFDRGQFDRFVTIQLSADRSIAYFIDKPEISVVEDACSTDSIARAVDHTLCRVQAAQKTLRDRKFGNSDDIHTAEKYLQQAVLSLTSMDQPWANVILQYGRTLPSLEPTRKEINEILSMTSSRVPIEMWSFQNDQMGDAFDKAIAPLKIARQELLLNSDPCVFPGLNPGEPGGSPLLTK